MRIPRRYDHRGTNPRSIWTSGLQAASPHERSPVHTVNASGASRSGGRTSRRHRRHTAREIGGAPRGLSSTAHPPSRCGDGLSLDGLPGGSRSRLGSAAHTGAPRGRLRRTWICGGPDGGCGSSGESGREQTFCSYSRCDAQALEPSRRASRTTRWHPGFLSIRRCAVSPVRSTSDLASAARLASRTFSQSSKPLIAGSPASAVGAAPPPTPPPPPSQEPGWWPRRFLLVYTQPSGRDLT
jgi:hypothetical protein